MLPLYRISRIWYALVTDCRFETSLIPSAAAINYRLAPETRFPGQMHDAVSAYMRLIIDLKIPPENIVSPL